MGQGDEYDVEEEEERRRDIFPQDLPTVVFGADTVAAFAPVVVG